MNRALDEIETAWAAGLFEGEGCISHESRWNKLAISMSMTDQDVMERFARWAGHNPARRHHTPSMQRRGAQVQWLWTCGGNKAELIIERMLPFLGARRTARYEEIMQKVYGEAA